MSSVNKAIIVGNLGRDPEIREMRTGSDKVATLTVATSERWKDRTSGEQRERTEWHKVVIFTPGLVEVASKYLRKGSKVYVEGQLQTRKWQDQAGNDRYTTEIVLRAFSGTLVLLDKAETGSRDYSSHLDGQARRDVGAGGGARSSPPAGIDPELDDDVPF